MPSCKTGAAAALARFIELLEASITKGEQVDTEVLVKNALQEAEKPACRDQCEEALHQATKRLKHIMALRLLYEECEKSKRDIIEKILSENKLKEYITMVRELHERMRQMEAELTLCRKRCGEGKNV